MKLQHSNFVYIQIEWKNCKRKQNSSKNDHWLHVSKLQITDDVWRVQTNYHLSYRRNDSYVAGIASNTRLCARMKCVCVYVRALHLRHCNDFHSMKIFYYFFSQFTVHFERIDMCIRNGKIWTKFIEKSCEQNCIPVPVIGPVSLPLSLFSLSHPHFSGEEKKPNSTQNYLWFFQMTKCEEWREKGSKRPR